MEYRPRPLPPRRRRRQALPSWAIGVLLALFLSSTAFAGYLIFVGVRDFVAELDLGGAQGHAPAGANLAESGTQVGGAAIPIAGTGAPHWTGTERVTVLVTGIDQREIETGPAHTDSILVVSADPVSRTASMLSIPRDLKVDIPLDSPMGDCSDHSINEANFWGDVYDYPGGGGPALAVQTVTLNFGIPINFYLRLNFLAFERIVDEVGGIDVNVAEPIEDPTYPDVGYGYEPFYLDAGPQHLNGHDALRYARTRATAGGDFDRAARQQEVVMALRQQVLGLGNLPGVVAKAPALYDALAGSYETNMTLDQMTGLAWLAADIPKENIHSAVIDQNYLLAEYTSCAGRQLLVPDVYKIGQEIVQPLFLAQLPPAPPATATPESAGEVNESENARISVQNGTTVVGIAWQTRDYLVSQGFDVTEVGNADRLDYPSTVLIDYTGKSRTVRLLAEALRIPASSIYRAPSRTRTWTCG